MSLLASCEEYSDRSFQVRTDRTKRGPSEKLRSEYFSHGANSWLMRALEES